MNRRITTILIGNAYGLKTHGGYGMDVFHPNGVCRCLNATHGGAAETLVIMEHPAILATERTERAKELRRRQGDKGARFSDRQYTVKQNDMSNTITTVQKDNLLIEPHSCAIRTRAYAGKPATIEMGGAVANALTSVQKDSLIVEPRVKSIGNRNPSGHGIGGEVYDCKGLAPTLCVNKGSGYTIAEPLRVRQATAQGYIECPVGGGLDAAYPSSELRRGRVQENGNVIGALTAQGDAHCVYEGRTIAYKEMPNGDIRAYQANSSSKAGVPEQMVTNPKNESPTITTAQTPKIMQNEPQYRIRKLTPVETGRLMGIDDADIHKMLDPVDAKGKPIISKSQAYKLHGNSIVVDVLYHIFRTMFIETQPTEPTQLTLF